MLYINNQAIDKTTDINQIIEAIKALPSPFSNLEEDKVIEDKSLLELLHKKIEFLGYIIENFHVNTDAFRRDLQNLKDRTNKQTIDYFECFSEIIAHIKEISKEISQSTRLASFF